MRVGINGWFWGQLDTGLGQYTTYLAAALAHTSIGEIVVITPRPVQVSVSSEQLAVSSGQFTIHNSPFTIHHSQFPLPPSPPARLWFEQITFPRLCHKLGVDVAFVPHPGMPLRPRLPTLTTLHDLIPLHFPAYKTHTLLRLYMKLGAAAWPHAHHLLTVSQASRQEIAAHLPVPPERITVIHPAAAPHFHTMPTAETMQRVRQQYRLPKQFILYLGGYGVHKNIGLLLQAYANLSSALRQNFPLVLAGALPTHSNQLYEDPRPRLRVLGLAEHIHLPGPIAEADKPALFAAATLFTFPSCYEGFGLPVLEAMHMGIPVLASHTSSLPEISQGAALLLPPDNPDAWTDALTHLCTHPEARTFWQARGRSQAQTFSWNAAARRLGEVVSNQ